jgi:hypothetical protein
MECSFFFVCFEKNHHAHTKNEGMSNDVCARQVEALDIFQKVSSDCLRLLNSTAPVDIVVLRESTQLFEKAYFALLLTSTEVVSSLRTAIAAAAVSPSEAYDAYRRVYVGDSTSTKGRTDGRAEARRDGTRRRSNSD